METEGRGGAHDLDLRPAREVVDAVVGGHVSVVAAVEGAAAEIARLADEAAARLARGGRVVYAGAGSAGRIAALDASEWGPTYCVPDETVTAIVAGDGLPPGCAEEAAAEDDAEGAAKAVEAFALGEDDVVIAVTASGTTPFALGALEEAKRAGAFTAAVVCGHGSPAARAADLAIETPVGPEVVSGSTRLKAGTAQKLVLNAFSTATMVRRGRTYGDLMAGMRVANAKLRGRAARVLVEATGVSEREAAGAMDAAGGELDVALVMVRAGVNADDARAALKGSGGAIRQAADNVAAKW
ncbi:MAG TPA: N-acetylmuramic acid 6-phosphate etherase [Solirubrobacteraceae bacterium]|nr:N-acetylmuramic acid 6-phosphate etherase [Solirubrobacteraceae bacterium]